MASFPMENMTYLVLGFRQWQLKVTSNKQLVWGKNYLRFFLACVIIKREIRKAETHETVTETHIQMYVISPVVRKHLGASNPNLHKAF